MERVQYTTRSITSGANAYHKHGFASTHRNWATATAAAAAEEKEPSATPSSSARNAHGLRQGQKVTPSSASVGALTGQLPLVLCA